MPKEALEEEYAKFEGQIAHSLKRVRTAGTFGEDGEDRSDLIELVSVLWVRNPRKRKELDKLVSEVMLRRLKEGTHPVKAAEMVVDSASLV